MTTIPLAEAQGTLPELLRRLSPGDEVILTENDQPLARIVPAERPGERQLGTLKGSVLYMAPDFDAPLDDFKEYQ